MSTYNTGITRAGSGSDPLVPEPVSNQIIQEMANSSVLLQRAKSVPMSSKTQRLPVLDVLPQAYWVTGDNGLKQTTNQQWKNVSLVAEELAAIVPIPESYLDDADVPIWDEVRPRLAAACGKLLDQAAFFGVNKPSTWSTDIYTSALNAGNVVISGTGVDFGVDVSNLAQKVVTDGFNINGFVARPGLNWKLVGIRSSQGIPIYEPDMQNGSGGKLYGYPISEDMNGAFDAHSAELIGGDWSKALVGLRQDITFKLFTEGVISDGSGVVVTNLMQQDSVALRVVMRVAFATANPVTELNSSSASRSPFGVVQAATAAS